MDTPGKPLELLYFRERALAASLKRAVCAFLHVVLLVFPRARARGLIEAVLRLRLARRGLIFPRARARGLIEASRCRVMAMRRAYFRERALAASLKLQNGFDLGL